MAIPPKWYQFLVGVFASFGSILYGYDLGVIAEVISCPSFVSYFGNPSATVTGAVVSVFTGGGFFGAMFAGVIGDWLGRKKTILLGAILFLLGGGLQTGAKSVAYLFAGRAFAGFGVGFLVMIIPLYQAEIAHPSIRGRITSLQQFMLGIGALVAAWGSWGTFNGLAATDNGQWRIPLGIQLIPAGILALLILLFPESPRWLMDHGKQAEALQTLARLHAHGNEEDPWVIAEFGQIQDAIAYEHEHEAQGYIELFTHIPSFRRLLLVSALQASVQMTGVSAIQYFSVDIYAQIGISANDSLKYQAVSSVLALIAQFSCILFIDKLGRRWTLIGGNLLNMVFFIASTALLFKYPPTSTNTGAHWGFIACTWLYNVSFSATCGPLSWVIPAEIFDTRTRAKGVSIGVMVSFAFNTMIGQVTPIAIQNIGYRYYILFIVCNFTNAVFFWLVLPETAKRPLEEMNNFFTKAPWIVVGLDYSQFESYDLQNRVADIAEHKGDIYVEAKH